MPNKVMVAKNKQTKKQNFTRQNEEKSLKGTRVKGEPTLIWVILDSVKHVPVCTKPK